MSKEVYILYKKCNLEISPMIHISNSSLHEDYSLIVYIGMVMSTE